MRSLVGAARTATDPGLIPRRPRLTNCTMLIARSRAGVQRCRRGRGRALASVRLSHSLSWS